MADSASKSTEHDAPEPIPLALNALLNAAMTERYTFYAPITELRAVAERERARIVAELIHAR